MKAAKLFFILLCLAALAAPAAAAGGAGTAANPYIIQTAAELQSMQNNLAAYYKLDNDINLQGVSFTPIGSVSSPFIGSFDGADYTISNLVISSSTQSTGFFSCLGSGATIKDVMFADCTVSSTSSRAGTVFGSIAMSATNNDVATIDNVDCVRCTVTASDGAVGAIGGRLLTTAVVNLRNCDVNFANVESTSSYGVGVVGFVFGPATELNIVGGSVKNSRFEVSGNYIGVIGFLDSASSASINDVDIENCIFEASGYAAGVVGALGGASSASMNDVMVKNCVMKCKGYAGGLIGLVDKDYTNNVGSIVTATNCIVSDSSIVATSDYAGGIGARIVSISTGVFNGCTVTGCTILANTYAAGICPAYS